RGGRFTTRGRRDGGQADRASSPAISSWRESATRARSSRSALCDGQYTPPIPPSLRPKVIHAPPRQLKRKKLSARTALRFSSARQAEVTTSAGILARQEQPCDG